MRPIVHPTTEILYESLGRAFTKDDESTGWHLLSFLDVFGARLGLIDDIVRDSDNGAGWTILLDVDRVPAKYLPYLAQFIGARLVPGVSVDEQRARVRNAEGFKRGTPGAIIQAAKTHLTGTQRVKLYERDGDDAYVIRLRTYTAETPDPVLVEAEARKQKAAGLLLTYEMVTGWTLDEMSAAHPAFTLDQLAAQYPDYTLDQLGAGVPA